MTELERLKMENDRLYSHHSECKKEMGELVTIANKWKIRSYATEGLLRYLNQLNPFWYPADLKLEIKIQTNYFLSKLQRREPIEKDLLMDGLSNYGMD